MSYREMQAALRDMVDSQGLTNVMVELAAVCDEKADRAPSDHEKVDWRDDADVLENITNKLAH